MKLSSNKISIRRIVWLVVIILAIYAFTFSPAAIQSRNMKQAEKEIAILKKELEKDARFDDVKFARSTAMLGKHILVIHSCDNEKELFDLKNMVKNHFDAKYHIVYMSKQNHKESE